MTTNTLALSHPAAAIAAHARHTAGLQSHRATIDTWLRALDLAGLDQLFVAVGGKNRESTALLLTEHQRGVALATAVLLGAKVRMLSAVARHAPGDTADERFQVTVEAFLTRAAARVKPAHKFVDEQLYWITLRTVTKLHQQRPVDAELAFDLAGPDVFVDIDSYLTAAAVLDWAQRKGVLTDADRRALDLRYGGDSALPVREVAARLGVKEDGLESRLRRTIARLRHAVAVDRDDLMSACIAARWQQTGAGAGHHTEVAA